MRNLKLTFALVAAVMAFASCKDEKQEKAQKSLERHIVTILIQSAMFKKIRLSKTGLQSKVITPD
jgi:hypothetical protein